MTLKEAIAHSLLMFVAASCVVLIVRALPQPERMKSSETAPAGGTNAGLESAASMPTPADGVVVYYFHGNIRCPTCRTIEAYAEETVRREFAEQIRRGELQWRVVNYETPGNEHFMTQFQLVAPTLVLAKYQRGRPARWESLQEVWEHVNNKTAFDRFVAAKVHDFLAEKVAHRSEKAPSWEKETSFPTELPIPE